MPFAATTPRQAACSWSCVATSSSERVGQGHGKGAVSFSERVGKGKGRGTGGRRGKWRGAGREREVSGSGWQGQPQSHTLFLCNQMLDALHPSKHMLNLVCPSPTHPA